jgi:molybdenum cofactor guanylyltransferase
MPKTSLDAYILCGGQSKRMGKEKANVPYMGQTFAEHIGQKLQSHFERIFVVSKKHQEIQTQFKCIYDEHDEHHPLWGISAAMNHSNHEYVFVVPCDIIKLEETDVLKILSSKPPCYSYDGKQIQPLLGVYPKEWASRTENAAANNLSVRKWSMDAQPVMLNSISLFNANHPWDIL